MFGEIFFKVTRTQFSRFPYINYYLSCAYLATHARNCIRKIICRHNLSFKVFSSRKDVYLPRVLTIYD